MKAIKTSSGDPIEIVFDNDGMLTTKDAVDDDKVLYYTTKETIELRDFLNSLNLK